MNPHGENLPKKAWKPHRRYRERRLFDSDASWQVRLYRFVAASWPILALIPAAAVTNLVLKAFFDDPWPPSEIAATVAFGLFITIATIAIGRRQSEIQKAIADTTLVAAVASIRGSQDSLSRYPDAGVAQKVITDARSALPLLKFSKPSAGQEFLKATLAASKTLLDSLDKSLRAHSTWQEGDWENISTCANELSQDLGRLQRYLGPDELATSSDLETTLGRISEISGDHLNIRFETFESSFLRGDVQERVRAMLDWEALRELTNSRSAKLTVARDWSVHWLEKNQILTVWHISPEGAFCNFYEDGAAPIPLNDIEGAFATLPAETQATINVIAQTFNFRTNKDGQHIAEVVTLQCSDGAVYLLDGNHRMSAIVRGPAGHRGPLGVQIVEYRIVSESDAPLIPELLTKPQQKKFHDAILEVFKKDRAASPKEVWTHWRSKYGTSDR